MPEDDLDDLPDEDEDEDTITTQPTGSPPPEIHDSSIPIVLGPPPSAEEPVAELKPETNGNAAS